MLGLEIITNYFAKNIGYLLFILIIIAIIAAIFFFTYKRTIKIKTKTIKLLLIIAIIYMAIPSFLFMVSLPIGIILKIITGILIILFAVKAVKVILKHSLFGEQTAARSSDSLVLLLDQSSGRRVHQRMAQASVLDLESDESCEK